MALGTVTEVAKGVMGDRRYAIVDVQLTSGANYTADGEAFDFDKVPGFRSQIDFVSAELGIANPPAAGAVVTWDRTNKKLVYFRSDNPNAAITELIEAAASANLSALTARLFVIGK